jgi:hypothetical protein
VRISIIILLIVLASILGGLYGALYDQFTYTIYPEFFTKMRFSQMAISEDTNYRWEVAKIGFKNTWPVGFGLGLFISVAGLLHQDNKKMFFTTLQGFFIALFTGCLFGLLALLHPESSVETIIEASAEIDVKDKASFNKVMSMNNYSYVGGVIGMFLGLGWQLLKTRHHRKN